MFAYVDKIDYEVFLSSFALLVNVSNMRRLHFSHVITRYKQDLTYKQIEMRTEII